MTSCRVEPYVIPAARMGRTNPLPDIKNDDYIRAGLIVSPNVPEHLTTHLNKGFINTLLPYQMNDDYDRNREDRAFNAVILENEHLKAVFLPELGGRLWSLFDKDNGREVLYKNPIYQPCNLALRNAWFSGGVEFNVSIRGHHPLTCDSMFAREITVNGTPGMRIYEYERIRGVAYGFDTWLPEGSKFLFIRPRIENRTGHQIRQYWWSNVAVPNHAKTRVIVPADETVINYYQEGAALFEYDSVPVMKGVDITYPQNVKASRDFFFYIPDEADKWMTAVDEGGYGLVQCSTKNQLGRKLFVWGDLPGGDNWSRYLCDGLEGKYLEIQAGLGRTQMEHIPMEDGEVATWVEAYGALQEDPDKLHGEWKGAQSTVANYLAENLNASLEELLTAPARQGELVHSGSGWGALENVRRKAEGEISLSEEFIFPAQSVSPVEQEWLMLLEEGKLDAKAPEAWPDSYLVDPSWYQRLQAAVENGSDNWYARMHLGVMAYAAGEVEESRCQFEASLALEQNAWSLRNLAMLYRNEFNDKARAVELMEAAVAAQPDCRGLWMDMATTCLMANEDARWVKAYNALSEGLKAEGRLKLYTAEAYAKQGLYAEARSYLNPELVVPDYKEGDASLMRLWFQIYGELVTCETGITDPDQVKAEVEKRYPLGELDFRMA